MIHLDVLQPRSRIFSACCPQRGRILPVRSPNTSHRLNPHQPAPKGTRIGSEEIARPISAGPQRLEHLGGRHTGKKKQLQEDQLWTESSCPRSRNDETRAWHEDAKADFAHHRFDEDADFSFFRFPGEVLFRSVNFRGLVKFEGAEFYDRALFPDTRFRRPCVFSGATFRGAACFESATFDQRVDFAGGRFCSAAFFSDAKFRNEAKFAKSRFYEDAFFLRSAFLDSALFLDTNFFKDVNFRDARFSRLVWFEKTTFSGDGVFDGTAFEGSSSFRDTSFQSSAAFSGITVLGVFALHSLDFRRVPDFVLAHFREAPAFDDVDLRPERFRHVAPKDSEVSLTARWRALRRLADQGRDHENQLLFHQAEITARRGVQDRRVHLRYWVGLGYQIFSNFGRSMSRPVLSLCISLLGFFLIYACASQPVQERPLAPSVSCVVGSGDPRMAALTMSIYNAVPFASTGLADLRSELHRCLYGSRTHWSFAQGESPYGFQNRVSPFLARHVVPSTPAIPLAVALLGVFQTLLSGILIFLFLLAVRNYFRIR